MKRYKKCDDLCDYETYYVNQAIGRGPRTLYVQRGSNWFTSFARRYAVPALKFIGKHVYETGRDIFHDVLGGKDIKDSAKTNLRKGISRSFKDLSERMAPQTGSSRKRKRRTKVRSKHTKKRRVIRRKGVIKKRRRSRKVIKKDIFN